MPRKNDTSFSFRGQSRVHAKQCIGRATNQYSCLTYTAWVETLYTGIGRTAILFFPCRGIKFHIQMHMKFNISCTTLFRRFFSKFEALFSRNDYLFMIQSTVRRQPLLFSIFLLIVGYHLDKTMRLLRRSTNRSIFDFFPRWKFTISPVLAQYRLPQSI